MAKHKEIETKWGCPDLSRATFKAKLDAFIERKDLDLHRAFVARGTDVYFRNKLRAVWRHRYGPDCHELTVKGRLSAGSITVRLEKNLEIGGKTTPDDVQVALLASGFKPKLNIYKDCLIYEIHADGAEIVVVWYRVKKSGRKSWDRYAEVEVNGVSEKKSLKILARWSKIMKDLYGLTEDDVSDLSLYEIYTGERYQNA